MLELSADHPGAYALVFVFGALWGSFANVAIVRLAPSDEHPDGRSVVKPPSHCMACNTPIRWYDNIPLVSYLVLRGRCRSCGTPYSPRYLLVEAATAMLFVALYHLAVHIAYVEEPIQLRLLRFVILAAFALVLVVITFIDLQTQMILDKITYPAIPVFYGCSLLLPEATWWRGLVGAAVGYGIVRLISDSYYLITKARSPDGKGEVGLGYGDGKLLAIIGALFGWQAVAVSLFGGSLIGTLVQLPLMLAGRSDRKTRVPFGPFLAAGALAYVFLAPWLAVSLSLLWG